MKCKITNEEIKPFMSFGKMPPTNGFLEKKDFKNETFYDMEVGFSEKISLFQLNKFSNPKIIHSVNYPFYTASSEYMKTHFKKYADWVQKEYLKSYSKLIEVGSNDGTFLKNFTKTNIDYLGFEPSKNVANQATKNNVKTINAFFNDTNIQNLKKFHNKTDVICAANVIAHIPDLKNLIHTVEKLLSLKGVFVFEEPYLGSMFSKTSYDQIYDEHPHLFSVTSLDNLLNNHGLELCRVDNLEVHGGSNRIFARLISDNPPEDSVIDNLKREEEFGLNDFETYVEFGKRVEKSKEDLLEILHKAKSDGKKVMTIGATCKSSIVFNYCGIDSSLIECITDTTPDKQNLLAPGSHIPVVDRKDIDITKYDYAFLGAWNFIDYIRKNETEFKGQYITHVPEVHCV